MAIDLTGKSIAITGASSGIGRATAVACARAGMNVVVAARRGDRLAEVVEGIAALRAGDGGRAGEGNARVVGRAVAVECDVARVEDCERLVARTVEEFGSIYAVFANAGYGAEASVHDMTDEEMRAIWDVNFFGTLNTIRPAVREMLKGKEAGGAGFNASRAEPRGHVLICSSCLGRFTMPRLSAYSATKAAQAHIGTAMRAELRGEGIHVSTVHPIGTTTEFFEQMQRKGVKADDAHRSPDFFTQPVEAVSERVVACLRRPRGEVWTGPKGWMTRLGAAVFTLSPRLGDAAARMHMKDS